MWPYNCEYLIVVVGFLHCDSPSRVIEIVILSPITFISSKASILRLETKSASHTQSNCIVDSSHSSSTGKHKHRARKLKNDYFINEDMNCVSKKLSKFSFYVLVISRLLMR